MKKICSQCRQEKPIQRFNMCLDFLMKSDNMKRNRIKNGLLSKKKVVVDNTLAGKMKSDIFLKTAFNFITASVAQAKVYGLTDKNDMDFTVFELAERLKNTKKCQKCGIGLEYDDRKNSLDAHIALINPISGGGKLKKDNLRVVCTAC